VPQPARPTLRCLRDDLTEDWQDARQRGALHDAPMVLPAFDTLDHPVVRHAASVFDGKPDTDAQRQGITGLTNPMWFKLKTGRWRGAVWEDDDGQAWLCAAGLRREKESTDFYAYFMSEVTGGGPGQFLPTDEDRRRLRVERAETALADWERGLHQGACDALVAAQEAGTGSFVVPGIGEGSADLSTVEIEAVLIDDEDGADGVAEVVVTFARTDWSHIDLAERADLIVLAAVQPDEQSWDPSSLATGPIYSLVMSPAELDALVAAVDRDGEPGVSNPGTTAHYAHRGHLTASTVEGSSVRGLCGKWFVPRQDHDSMPTCDRCDAVMRTMKDQESAPG
jgi:hypothetical protein